MAPLSLTFQTLTTDEHEDDISIPHGGAIGNRSVSGRAFSVLRRKAFGDVRPMDERAGLPGGFIGQDGQGRAKSIGRCAGRRRASSHTGLWPRRFRRWMENRSSHCGQQGRWRYTEAVSFALPLTDCGLTMAPLHKHTNKAMSNEQEDKQSTGHGGAIGKPAVRCWACIYADNVSVLGVDGKWYKTRTAHCMAEGSWANGEGFYRKVYEDTFPPSCVRFTPCT